MIFQKELYLSHYKKIIDKFIIQSRFFEFSESNVKYTQHLKHVISVVDQTNDYQLDLQDQDKILLEQLQNQYQEIKECKDMFMGYFDSLEENYGNQQEIDEMVLYYFKMTYLISFESQRKELKVYYSHLSQNNKNLENIVSVIEELRKNYQEQQSQNDQAWQKSYENILHLQNFNKTFLENKIFESYKINQKEAIQQTIKEHFKEEEEFFNDLLNCICILGEELKIQKQKQDKENFYIYAEYCFIRNEFFQDLVEKYSLENQFQFFNKYNVLKFFTDPTYIEKMSKDELVLYFYVVSAFYLIKFNYLPFNIENNFYRLVNKLSKFETLKQNAGILFTMKIIKDLKQKDCLEEDLYFLFEKWNNQPDYKVNDNWINKQQIQLFIETAQSFIKLAVIPELARFYFKCQKPIPFLISNHEYAIVQHILIGKQFYLKHPNRLNEQIIFWKDLCDEITKIEEINKNGEINYAKVQFALPHKICKINLHMCQILLDGEDLGKNIYLEELDCNIEYLIKLIDRFFYLNLYRRKQTYFTLESLFVKEEIVIPIIIKKIKNSQKFFESTTNFLLLSFREDFDIRHYILFKEDLYNQYQYYLKNNNNANEDKKEKEKSSNFIQKKRSSKEFDHLFERYKSARKQLFEIKANKQEILQQFKDILKDFKFLNKSKYIVFKLNIEFYIRKIEIETENKKLSIQFRGILSSSQFQLDFIEMNGNKYVRKWINENLNNKRLGLNQIESMKEQIINECSILQVLQNNGKTHKNVIKIIDYIANTRDGKIELILEHCSNGTLFRFLQQILSKEQRIDLCIGFIEGVEFLHENNILHGDLKLDNIVIDSNHVPKIIDFGTSVYLIEQNEMCTLSYQSNDQKQSLFKEYFSIGMILFSILLQDCQFSVNYKNYRLQKNENQSKKLLKKYFKYEINNKQQQIEREFSLDLFKAILSLFNDQPYFRPKLSEIIQILKNHKNEQNEDQTNKQIKYSIKEAINQLQNQNKNSNIAKQIIKRYFAEYMLKDDNKENVCENQQQNQQTKDKNQDEEITIKKGKNKQMSNQEEEITIKKGGNKQLNEINQNTNSKLNEQLPHLNQKQNKQMIDISQIQIINQINISNAIEDINQVVHTYDDLTQYFIKNMDKEQMYDIKLFEVIRHKQFDIRKLQIDIGKFLTPSNHDRFNMVIQYFMHLISNKELFQILVDVIGEQKIQYFIRQAFILALSNEQKRQEIFNEIYFYFLMPNN